MEEQYTLEEWLGMLEEAGYDISEQDPPTKSSTTPYRAISPADSSTMVARTPAGPERDAMAQRIGVQNMANQLAALKKAQGRQGGLSIRPTNPIPEVATLNESTVSRLQQLAGINPIK